MNSVAFESKRPVPKVDFVPPDPADGNLVAHGQFREVSKILEWFLERENWIIISGPTSRSREIRRALIRSEIKGNLRLSAKRVLQKLRVDDVSKKKSITRRSGNAGAIGLVVFFYAAC